MHPPAQARNTEGRSVNCTGDIESYKLASKQKARFVREVQLEEGNPVQQQIAGHVAKEPI